MSYVVLARKYRPKNFQAMIGQEHVLRALTNALEKQRLHHAYLFTGTRGVGKTTVARAFAKSLSCERGISANPCGECHCCVEIDQGRYIDLIEIDAASRTKVEDTRELLENVQYSPQAGRFKIYIIDEVHMLSSHSFNALLKTLEEPPRHVKFLLATTDPQRLPVTVLSRCLQFHLKNLSPQQITDQLITVLNQENLAFETAALSAIAKAAKGSMRDALSLLDQCIAYGNGEIKEHEVSIMLGLISEQKIKDIMVLLQQQDATTLLQKIDELAELGADFHTVLDDIIALLQQIAVIQLLNDAKHELYDLAMQFSVEDIQLYYQIGLLGKRDLPLAPESKCGFTMTILRMLAFTPNDKKANKIISSPKITETSNNKPKETIPIPKLDNVITSQSLTNDKWPSILNDLRLTGVAQLLAQNCTLATITDSMIDLSLDENHASLLNPATQERLTKALQSYTGNPCKVTITIGKSTAATPAQLQTQKQLAAKQQVQEKLMNDPQVKVLMETFSATLQPESLIAKEMIE